MLFRAKGIAAKEASLAAMPFFFASAVLLFPKPNSASGIGQVPSFIYSRKRQGKHLLASCKVNNRSQNRSPDMIAVRLS